MIQTFANLPLDINEAISSLLSRQKTTQWISRAEKLHNRYMTRDKEAGTNYINDFQNVLAYLGLRTPATYAQIYGALSQVKEMIPSWKPKSILDIGSGPGTGVWAAKTIWPSLKTAICIDQEKDFLLVGKEIMQKSSRQLNISFKQEDITQIKDHKTKYDLILIANVLNELTMPEQKDLLKQAFTSCNGLMLIIEPGTPLGIKIVQESAKIFSSKSYLLAPYLNNTFVESNEHWIHFSQRFIRPEFQRRIRQHMRESSLMASDWEETQYAYMAIGKFPVEKKFWGRVIGPIKKQKGLIEVAVLTENGVIKVKVLKRNKKEYSFAKNLRWGQVLKNSIVESSYEKDTII